MDRPRHPADELFGASSEWTSDRWRPALDVFETEKAIVVRVELPGVHSGDVKVTVDGDTLQIRGMRRAPSREGVVRPHRMEIAFGPFERRVRIGAPFERDQVVAQLEDGFLTVELPKRDPGRQRIEIRTEPEDPV